MEFSSLMPLFESYLKVEKRASPHTLLAYKVDLEQFIHYFFSLAPTKKTKEISTCDIRGWIVSLVKEGINHVSINRKMAAVRSFYNFLQSHGYRSDNPIYPLKSLKTKKRLPVFIQEKELLSFLDYYPFSSDFPGLRDRLLLELLYGTGMRRAELLMLRQADINLPDGFLKVVGKRNKERIVPFPKVLKPLIQMYLLQKKQLGYVAPFLIVTDSGKPCYPMFIYRVIKKYLSSTTRSSRYSPHVLRHTFATHLLDHGADLQAIKELLGHANLSATQIYTHNSLSKLKEVFKKAHPRAEENV